MKALLAEIRPAVMATLALATITCVAYPLGVTAAAKAAFPKQAVGSLIRDAQGSVQGSSLLSQNFTQAQYFHPRPSAAGNGYDATSSSGSNLGPTSQKLHDLIKERVTAYRQLNDLPVGIAVPADAVTASGSGLDPHISLANASLQLPRVARARKVSPEKMQQLVTRYITTAWLGILGEPGVNVLLLNRALDEMK